MPDRCWTCNPSQRSQTLPFQGGNGRTNVAAVLYIDKEHLHLGSSILVGIWVLLQSVQNLLRTFHGHIRVSDITDTEQTSKHNSQITIGKEDDTDMMHGNPVSSMEILVER